MISISVFGDSIGKGYNDFKKGGWVNQLKRYFHNYSDKIHIYNFSISGDSTREVIKRFDNEAKSKKSDIIIFALGTNDSWYLNNNKPNVSIDDFKSNLQKLILKANNIGAKTIFIGLPKVDESKVMPIPWRTEASYNNKNILKYNQAIKKICKEYKLQFIEINHILDNSDLSDGIHPNTKGHTKLFEEIKSNLSI